MLTALPSVANAVAVAERDVTIATPDGTCDAYFVAPTSGPAPAVLVWPDIFGLRPAFRQMGRRLAESGYSVLVVNPFYRQKKAPTAPQGGKTPIAEVLPLMQALTPAMHLTDGKAFVAWLDAQREVDKARKIGTTGYCMGAPIAVRTATVAPGRVGAVGSFHGAAMVTSAPDSPHRLVAQTKAHYLIAVAENDDQKDPQAKVALRTALEAAKLRAEVEVYPAAHGWCPPDTQVYDAAQSERAWARLLATLKEALA
ncbi:dienelactone hydrolase family protein [Ramlibacter sp.]|uniref:dienelactone hydrolase family protein n=1 Tax=Ramlibacter sp. TaxID=1917967 RepID=UPI003D0F24BC